MLPAPATAQRKIGLAGQREIRVQGRVRAKAAANLCCLEANVAGIRLDVLVDRGSCACLISERRSSSLRLVTGPFKDSIESAVTGVNGKSFRPTLEVNFLVEIGVASMESALLGPNLAVSFIIVGD